MKIGSFDVTICRNGVTVHQTKQAGPFNEQRVSERFISIQPKLFWNYKTAHGVGSFTARVWAYGPVVWGKFTY